MATMISAGHSIKAAVPAAALPSPASHLRMDDRPCTCEGDRQLDVVQQPVLVAGGAEICAVVIKLHDHIVTLAFAQVKGLKTTLADWQEVDC
ncbi:hypothetical protein OHB44_10060 [Micromonospora sp. NBC_00821]|uniref:hypothetical protein n=1 Tax=Micromonospora sp. NBC_00821 TaxID=2975977 RepID=UPI002ED3922D|nr:hypothetical protein OHB44_10060 [Micromonospora sp. NBC_00821]